MSDLNPISEDVSNQNEHQAPSINDESKTLTSDSVLKAENEIELHINNKRQDDDNQNVPRDINKKLLDDDNNTQSPAYIPRKGKFYEHDDRTIDDNHQPKQELSRNQNRFYRDLDTKWQHDLYFRDERISKSRNAIPRQTHHRSERNNNHDREQFHSNDHMYHRRQVSYENSNKPQNDRINNSNRSLYDKVQTTPRRQRHDDDPYQVDERTFHRRRNFTNTQDNLSKSNNSPKRNEPINEKNRSYLPPRLQINNNRNLIQNQQNPPLNLSNTERPKRYSNMRNTMTNPIQQQVKHCQDQQNDWPQAPPPPTSYLSQQIKTSQMYYNQQTSRYVSMNYSQGSISQQFQENE